MFCSCFGYSRAAARKGPIFTHRDINPELAQALAQPKVTYEMLYHDAFLTDISTLGVFNGICRPLDGKTSLLILSLKKIMR